MGSERRRFLALHILFLLIFAGVLSRLFWLQIVQYKAYEALASRQQTVTQTLQAKRGEIFMHEKDNVVPVVSTKDGWLLALDPRKVSHPETLYAKLMELGPITMQKEEFITRASKKDDPYEPIEHRMPNSTKKRIEDAHIPGVFFLLEDWRSYSAGAFASHVIGFVDSTGDGKYGIERYYNKDLIGEDGKFEGEMTPTGRLLLLGKTITHPEKDGVGILLTIDSGVQKYLEDRLHDVLEQYHARSAGGIIIEPKTGKILAMGALPMYDPNEYAKEKDASVFKNPLVENVFEMGSIMKPLTMAAGIDTGAVTPETTYFDPGHLIIDGAKVSNYDGKSRGTVPMQEILSQSLNTGSVFVMQHIGRERFLDYIRAYGFGSKTGIDLPNETVGNFKNLDSPRMIEYATASFGQGISETPIEFVRALSSLANGGLLVNPYVVEELRYENGEVVQKKKDEPKRILKEDTSKTVTRMLVTVVDTKLANGKGKIPGYSVAAKTGTAQIASLKDRGYSGDFMHTFFGYGPAYDPRFLVFYYVERPQGVQYASETLTQPFRQTMKYLFSYFEVPPDRPQDLTPAKQQ